MLLQEQVGRSFGVLQNLSSILGCTLDALANQILTERPLSVRLPVEPNDLIAGKPHQGVAATQGVVEKREGVIFRQRGQPQAELGEIDGHRVLVHAVQAALRDEPARVEHFVFVWRN